MRFGRCPSQAVLEEYYYNHLPRLKSKLVDYHVCRCLRCQRRLDRIQEFDLVISHIPYEEPSPGLSGSIMEFVEESTRGTVPKGTKKERVGFWHGGVIPKMRWATSAVLLLANLVFVSQYKHFGGGFASSRQILNWDDLRFGYRYLNSGEFANTLGQILVALRANGVFVFEIMNDVLPDGLFNVVICGGLAFVTWIAYLLASRNEVAA